MSATDIVKASSPAIVRIEAGDHKVGTGFVVDRAGMVATNLHVIQGETDIKVHTFDGAQYSVMSVAAYDPGHDLALIRIAPHKPLPTLTLGDSNAVSAGDTVIAIGNPLGVFDYSVSAGLISQVRPVSADLTILQISAPISPGSSGGPLFNQFGEVIGVTTAIINTEGAENINLAVPGNYLRPLIQHPRVVALADFAKDTKEKEDKDTSASSGEDDKVEIVRKVPVHPVTVWDGCTQKDVEEVVKAISDAIETGAPAYNRQSKSSDAPDFDPHGFEACFRIYEGTALKWEKEARCAGVRSAFGDGLLRAGSLETYKEKAWAMRDTFDGLIEVAQRWARGHQKP
ncbi:MAG TPA: S1C family serine protease [Kofleriaceae bacterium]|nr:S1C family serine protease [Kofleriaceae bacterium]